MRKLGLREGGQGRRIGRRKEVVEEEGRERRGKVRERKGSDKGR